MFAYVFGNFHIFPPIFSCSIGPWGEEGDCYAGYTCIKNIKTIDRNVYILRFYLFLILIINWTFHFGLLFERLEAFGPEFRLVDSIPKLSGFTATVRGRDLGFCNLSNRGSSKGGSRTESNGCFFSLFLGLFGLDGWTQRFVWRSSFFSGYKILFPSKEIISFLEDGTCCWLSSQ